MGITNIHLNIAVIPYSPWADITEVGNGISIGIDMIIPTLANIIVITYPIPVTIGARNYLANIPYTIPIGVRLIGIGCSGTIITGIRSPIAIGINAIVTLLTNIVGVTNSILISVGARIDGAE
jgi:hypothetical protein